MKCPKCNHNDSQFISNVVQKGFHNAGAGNRLAYCCFGMPIGICGDSGKTSTIEYWICNNCGTKFQESDIGKRGQQIQEYKKIINGATKEELSNLEDYVSKAKSKLEKATKNYDEEWEREKIQNTDIIKAKKIAKMILISSIISGIIGILLLFSFNENSCCLSIFFFIFLVVGIIMQSNYKKKEILINKYGSAKLMDTIKKKEQAQKQLGRLEGIAQAKNEFEAIKAFKAGEKR